MGILLLPCFVKLFGIYVGTVRQNNNAYLQKISKNSVKNFM